MSNVIDITTKQAYDKVAELDREVWTEAVKLRHKEEQTETARRYAKCLVETSAQMTGESCVIVLKVGRKKFKFRAKPIEFEEPE